MHHARGQRGFAEFNRRGGSEGIRAGTEDAPRPVNQDIDAQGETKYGVGELPVKCDGIGGWCHVVSLQYRTSGVIMKQRSIAHMKEIPQFKSEDDERKFWDTADSTTYVDWLRGKRKKLIELKPTLRTISLRLPAYAVRCGEPPGASSSRSKDAAFDMMSLRTPMRDFDENNITAAVIDRYKNTPDPRLKKIMSSLVQHLHDFVRDVEPTEAEWGQAIDFLTRTGKLCTDKRQEFILLSDTLGVSMLVDAINHRFSKDATESTVMGPFYVQNPPEAAFGADIRGEAKGDPLYIDGSILSEDG